VGVSSPRRGRASGRRVPLDVRGLAGESALFRLDPRAGDDPAVRRWLADRPGELGAIARTWYGRLTARGTDVRERFHDGCAVACVADAPFAYVNAFKGHVSLGFFAGAMLPDPARLLRGTGKRMRHVKIVAGEAPDGAGLEALIDAAYADIRRRLEDERAADAG